MKNKPKKHKDTMQYVDIPEGGIVASIDGGENTPLADVPNTTYLEETETHYGLLIFNEEVETVDIDGNPVPVLNGAHPTQKPK
jgi:hypothetical protein